MNHMSKGKTEWSLSPYGITMSNRAAAEAGFSVGHAQMSSNQLQQA